MYVCVIHRNEQELIGEEDENLLEQPGVEQPGNSFHGSPQLGSIVPVPLAER